jgi:hypothetical protein
VPPGRQPEVDFAESRVEVAGTRSPLSQMFRGGSLPGSGPVSGKPTSRPSDRRRLRRSRKALGWFPSPSGELSVPRQQFHRQEEEAVRKDKASEAGHDY